jgi:uncharacterized protein (TIGR03435 family)
MTGIQGLYDFDLDISAEDMIRMKMGAEVAAVRLSAGGGDVRPAEGASDTMGASIFSAVQQYGLKLDPRKAPVDILVVDRVEKLPTDN